MLVAGDCREKDIARSLLQQQFWTEFRFRAVVGVKRLRFFCASMAARRRSSKRRSSDAQESIAEPELMSYHHKKCAQRVQGSPNDSTHPPFCRNKHYLVLANPDPTTLPSAIRRKKQTVRSFCHGHNGCHPTLSFRIEL